MPPAFQRPPRESAEGLAARPGWPGMRLFRWAIVAALAASVLVAVAGTLRWPLVGDAPLMHYVVFLMDHGRAPYREIQDINFPGTYALEWAAMHLLGPGAAGWRAFDLLLLAVSGAAMVAIAWPLDWLAGIYGAALFALLHLRDGPPDTGQRDLTMAALLLASAAFLLAAGRRTKTPRARAGAAVAFGLLAGAAVTVKPSAAGFAVVFAAMLAWRLRSLGERVAAPLLAACVGLAAPVAACGVFLVHEQALADFWRINRGLVVYHASLGRPSLLVLVVGSFPSVLLAAAVPAFAVAGGMRPWRAAQVGDRSGRWEYAVLAAGFVLGCASYVLQGKPFPYHRYPAEAFLALGCGLLLAAALKREGWMRWTAVLGLAAGAFYLAPASARIACRFDWRNQEFNRMLEADLANLTAQRGSLEQKVQCVDMTSGCLNTLYNVRLLQATGYLYDCYLFEEKPSPVREDYRAGFWSAMEKAKPEVLVVTNQECFSLARTWELPQRWPAFAALLASDYTMVAERTPPHLVGWWRKPQVPYAYRLYVRKPETTP